VLGQVGDTAVVGISKDTPAAQAKFDAKYSLGFRSSPTRPGHRPRVRRVGQGDVRREGVLRSAFLVDEQGRIERACTG